MKAFETGSPFNAWVVATALGFACLEALNPTIWFSADVLGLARVVAAAGDAVIGLVLGAAIGAVIGFIAGLMWARRPPKDPKAALKASRRFFGQMVFAGIVVGLAAGGLDFAITPERASFVACTTIQSDYDAAVGALKDGAPKSTIASVTKALPMLGGCHGSAGSNLMAGALYTLRGAAYLQTDILPTRANVEFARAAKLVAHCADDFPPGSGPRAAMCQQYTVSVSRYTTQHFCDDALSLANQADNEVYHDAAQAKELAQRGAAAAAKCKNLLSYAYRGIALAEQAQAQVALGQAAAGTLRESRQLVGRCLRDGTAGGLLGECRNAQRILAATSSGQVP